VRLKGTLFEATAGMVSLKGIVVLMCEVGGAGAISKESHAGSPSTGSWRVVLVVSMGCQPELAGRMGDGTKLPPPARIELYGGS